MIAFDPPTNYETSNYVLHTVHCKSYKMEKFCSEEMNCNLLEKILSCMVVLCGQTLLHKGIITNWFEKFPAYQLICENCKTFPPWTISDIWYVAT